MLFMLAGPFFLLAAIALPGPFSRLAGIVVLAVLVGITWRAAAIGSFDLLLLTGGATLARRFGFAKPIAVVRARRIAAAFLGFLGLEFGTCALLIANLTGDAADALPFDLGLLLSGVALAVFVSRNHEQVFTRRPAGSLVFASPQA
ncbi:MAG TPA: hypothetical protein VHT03_06730 [Rhizomicrobium sp.]|jgi:hypothetical protein|nr:hypothetical protein [Rhizomicrobium sp.]